MKIENWRKRYNEELIKLFGDFVYQNKTDELDWPGLTEWIVKEM